MAEETPGTAQTDGEPEGDQAQNTNPEDAQSTDPEAALGDAGKKALQEERAARKAAERELADLRQEVSRLRRSNAAVKDVDLDAIKSEIRQEFDQRLLAAEIKAVAAGRLADPADAMRYGDYFEGLSADDSSGIKSAIDRLLKEKPYLAVQDAGPKPWGDVGSGPREAPADPEPSNPQERLARAYGRKAN